MVYLLDANVFIESKNRHYGFDFCPAFWDWLDAQNHAGQVYSVERVADELKKDDLGVDNNLTIEHHYRIIAAGAKIVRNISSKAADKWPAEQERERPSKPSPIPKPAAPISPLLNTRP